jgi:glucose dehydrogenase
MCSLAVILVAASQTDWRFYGHDAGGMRYSPLSQITRGNVSRLGRAWTFHTGDLPAASGPRGQRRVAFETTPLAINGVLYLSTPASRIIALDGDSGRQIWKFDPQSKHAGALQYRAHRGVAYWPGEGPGEGKMPPRIFAGTLDGRLIALDARTGAPAADFGTAGEVNLRAQVADNFPDSTYAITSPPAIFEDLVITGAEVPESPGHGPSGDVRAWNARSGKLVWQFHTWTGDAGEQRTGVNVWTGMTVDEGRGMVFLPIGSPAYDFYGGDRIGAGLYGDSLVALNARTGKLVWKYQFVHHDVWDYDPPAPPVLITVHRHGREIPAVVEVTKMGLVFIFDRRDGTPVFGVEERPVPQSNVPGEKTWPTQPFPVRPPPLSRNEMKPADLTEVTPESRRECEAMLNKLENSGPYTPYGLHPTLVFPGTLGGANWSGASFDPKLGYLFVNTNEVGATGEMVEQSPGGPLRFKREGAGGENARFWDSHLRPCQTPPWGLLNAINVNSGEIAWRVPLGVTEGMANTGALNLGGSITTAGGLIFIAATNDERFRAFEATTGRELWSAPIDGSGHATPMMFQGRSGRQYVVIAAGGGGFFGSTTADALIAFALPVQ